MAYIPNNSPKEGEWIRLKHEHKSLLGTFEAGTLVKITGTSGYRGYNIEDAFGNCMYECGWDL